MGCISFIFSTKFLLIILLISAIPIGIIISLERAPPSTHVYQYHSNSWLRECAKWDDLNRRFLVSYMEGGIGEVKVSSDDHDDGRILEEITAVKDAELAGNATLGLTVDRRRNRVVAVVADLLGNRYGGLAAYDLSSWQRLFLTHLTNPEDGAVITVVAGGFDLGFKENMGFAVPLGDEKSFADDVAIDEDGNAFVTDIKGNKIWKIDVDGKFLSTINSPLFTPKEWYKKLFGLNGIVYHPNGYLLVIHTNTGNLFKIDLNKGEQVKLVKIVKGSLVFGDGLELLSSTKLVVAGNPAARLVETSDGWETASVVGTFSGMMHRLATSATMKDDKVYVNHMIGLGYPKRKHVIVEAVFTSH